MIAWRHQRISISRGDVGAAARRLSMATIVINVVFGNDEAASDRNGMASWHNIVIAMTYRYHQSAAGYQRIDSIVYQS